MSPPIAGSSRTVSPWVAGFSNSGLDSTGENPADEVDLLPVRQQSVQEWRLEDKSSKPPSYVSENHPTPTMAAAAPQLEQDLRGAEALFRFAPAPRYVSGHFSNRKIVPRTEDPDTRPQLNQQLTANHTLKEHSSGSRPTSPASDISHSQQTRLPPPSPFTQNPLAISHTTDSDRKDSVPKKRIGLPFAKTQPVDVPDGKSQIFNVNSRAQTTVQDSTEVSQPLDAFRSLPHTVQPTSSSIFAPESPHPRTLEEQHRSSQVAQAKHDPVTGTQGKPSQGLHSFRVPENVRTNPGQVVGLTIVGHPEQNPPTEAAVPKGLIGSAQEPERSLLAPALRSKAQSASQQRVSNHLKEQPGIAQRHHRMEQTVGTNTPASSSTRSASISSGSSGLSTKRTRSTTNDLTLLKERGFPQVTTDISDLLRLSDQAVENVRQERDMYRAKLGKRTRRLAELVDITNLMNQEIRTSEAEKQSLRSHMEELQRALQVSGDRFSILIGKGQTIKDMLSTALKEKQELLELHNCYKMKSDRAIQEIRAEKQQEQSLRELIDRQLSAVREQMKERVRQVEQQSQEECCRMTERMQLLQQQAEEKDAQLRREKDITDKLTKQIGDAQKPQSSLEDIQAQMSSMVRMMGERQDVEKLGLVVAAQEESNVKLVNVSEHLAALRDMLGLQCEAVSKLSTKQDEGISTIVSTLKTMSETQNGSRDGVAQLGKDMRSVIEQMRQQIENAAAAITQKLGGNCGESATLREVINRREQERQALRGQLSEAQALRKAHEERSQGLLQAVARLEAESHEDFRVKGRSEALAKENDELKGELATKHSRTTDLEARLKAENDNYKAEVGSLSKELGKLTHLMNESTHAAKLATEKAVGEARDECGANYERAQARLQERLQEAREARRLAVQELETSKKDFKSPDAHPDGNDDRTNKVTALQTDLEEAELRNRKLVEDLQDIEGKLSTQTGAFESIGKWLSGKAEACGVKLHIGRLWGLTRDDGDDGKHWTSFLDAVFAELDRHRASSCEVPQAATTFPQTSVNAQSGSHATPLTTFRAILPRSVSLAQESASSEVSAAGPQSQQTKELHRGSEDAPALGDGLKRATVVSPDSGVLTPVPPTIEQERSRRRDNVQKPKPITKRVTRSTPHAEELLVGQNRDPASLSPRLSSGKNSKRAWKTSEPQPDSRPSLIVPREEGHSSTRDDDDTPLSKRAKTQKPTPSSSASHRGRARSSKAKQQPQRSGLAAGGVVQGRLPPGVPGTLPSRHPLPSQPLNVSQAQNH